MNIEYDKYLRTLAKVSSINIIGMFVLNGIGFMNNMVFANVLGVENYGRFGVLSSLVGLISVFTILGLTKGNIKYGSIYYSKNDGNAFISLLFSSFGISGMVGTLFSILVFVNSEAISILYFKDIQYNEYLQIFSLGILLSSSLAISKSFLNSIQKNEYTVYTVIGQKIFNIGFVTLSIVFLGTIGLDTFIKINLASTMIVIIVNVILLIRSTRFTLFDKKNTFILPGSGYWSLSLSILGVEFISSIASYSDKILLGGMSDVKEAGLYVFASALGGFVIIVTNAFQNIFGPIIASIYTQNKTELLKELYGKVTNWIIIFTLPIFWGLVLFYPALFNPTFNEYSSAYNILIILVLAKMVTASSGMDYNIFAMTGSQNILLRLTIITTALVLIIQYLLIPYYGGIGASIPILLVALIRFGISFRVLKRKYGLQPYNSGTFKSIIISSFVFIGAFYFTKLNDGIMMLIIVIPLATFIYLFFIYRLVADDADKNLLRKYVVRWFI